jgi:feruloyl-CoA synthase
MGPDLSAQASVVREGLAQPDIVKETRPDGSFVLRSRMPLLPYRRSVIDWLVPRRAGPSPRPEC